MPKGCCVVGCTTNSKKNKGLKFHLIPISGRRRDRWLRAINRCQVRADGSVNHEELWEPKSNYSYVCGRHFITGEKSSDETDPDYVPSIFPSISESSTKSSKSESKVRNFDRQSGRGVKRKASMQETWTETCLKLDHPYPQNAELNCDGHTASEIPECSWTVPLQAEDCEDNAFNVDPHDSTDVPDWCEETEDTSNCLSSFFPEPLSVSEREQLYKEMDILREERDEAVAKAAALENLMLAKTLCSTAVERNDEKCKLMTGLKWTVFQTLFTFVSSFVSDKGTTKVSLPLHDQLFLTLMKLRHNVSFEFLAFVIGIPKTTCIDYFWKWIDLLHGKVGFLVKYPDRENIFQTIPPVFQDKFPRLTCIVDCFEMSIDAPNNLPARALCSSEDKEQTTVKVFVGCNPYGMVTYLSRAWGGSVSDVQMVRESGFIDSNYHHPGDQILADREFPLAEDFASKCSCELLTPAKETSEEQQLSAREAEISCKISSVRIYIERVTGLMKDRFHILKGQMPIRRMPRLRNETLGRTLASCDKIITVCAALTNMGESIVYKE